MAERWDGRTASWISYEGGGKREEGGVTAKPIAAAVDVPPPSSRLPPPGRTRSYNSALDTRFTVGWQSGKQSADAMLAAHLAKLRGRSRALVRDNPYAKRAKQITVNNVIGSGIGMQGAVSLPRGAPLTRINDAIESTWESWCCADSAHTGGALCFPDLERLLMGEVFEAGEAFVRMHDRPFGKSEIPFALEYIEPERMAEEFDIPQPGVQRARVGIELDPFGRASAYYFHSVHPGELRINLEQHDEIVRMPADVILHLYICTRWPQHRGEPWLHATARRLYDMDAYSEAEIIGARSSAAYMGFIKTPGTGPAPDLVVAGQQQISLEPGVIERLGPDEDFISHNPNRPNAQLEPFMRYMLREVASGTGSSYESLSRDYSQSNYSSSRLSLLDDRDHWKALQHWFIRSFRVPLHRMWLSRAVLAGAIPGLSMDEYLPNIKRYSAAKFKPRGWGWVDPTKEVEAYKEAIRAGFTTQSRVISMTGDGMDLEDVLSERRRELDMAKELDLEFDTEKEEAPPPPPKAATPKTETDDPFARVVSFVRP